MLTYPAPKDAVEDCLSPSGTAMQNNSSQQLSSVQANGDRDRDRVYRIAGTTIGTMVIGSAVGGYFSFAGAILGAVVGGVLGLYVSAREALAR